MKGSLDKAAGRKDAIQEQAHNTFIPEVEGKGWIQDRTDSAPNIQISSLQHGQYTAKVFSSSTVGRALSSDPARLFLCVCVCYVLICRWHVVDGTIAFRPRFELWVCDYMIRPTEGRGSQETDFRESTPESDTETLINFVHCGGTQ